MGMWIYCLCSLCWRHVFLTSAIHWCLDVSIDTFSEKQTGNKLTLTQGSSTQAIVGATVQKWEAKWLRLEQPGGRKTNFCPCSWHTWCWALHSLGAAVYFLVVQYNHLWRFRKCILSHFTPIWSKLKLTSTDQLGTALSGSLTSGLLDLKLSQKSDSDMVT